MKRLSLTLLIILLVSGVIFGGCAKPAPAPTPAQAPVTAPAPAAPIKIGVVLPLTGVMAMTSQWIINGINFGFDEVGNKVAGRNIQVIIADEGSRVDMTLDSARKLVEQDNVSMLIGPLMGGDKVAAASYMAKAGRPHLPLGPSAWQVSDYKWSFNITGAEAAYSYSMGRYAYDQAGFKTVTIITEDTIAGHSFLDPFMDAFKKSGGQVIQEQYPPMGTQDFGAYLTNLKNANAVVAWFQGGDAIAFFIQYHQLGIDKRMPLVAAFHGGFFQPFILAALPPDVGEAMIGYLCPTEYTALLQSDASKRFTEAFQKKYNYIPGEAEDIGYGCALAALKALAATGGDTTPEKLRQAILALDFEEPGGRIRIDPQTGFAVRNIYIFKIDKMGKEYVWAPVYEYKGVPPKGF